MFPMTSALKSRARLSPAGEALVAEGVQAGHTIHKIQRKLRVELKEKISLKTLAQKKENHQRKIGTKKLFKKKGADMVRNFLEKAKEGGDVSDLQAVLEQAVYFDCLRRYAADEDNFLQDVNTKELLKITHDYQKARLRQASASSSNGAKSAFSPVHAIELLGIVEESLADIPELKSAFLKRRESVMEKIKPLFNPEEFKAASEDYEALQKIREKYELSRQNSNGEKEGIGNAAS